MTCSNPPCVAVVLAGGTSRRWGGGDKTASPLAGVPLLVHAVAAVAGHAATVVVVAPAEHPAHHAVRAAVQGRPLIWTREHPPGAGPVAGLAAGLAALAALPEDDRAVAVLAGDQPFTRTAWPRLRQALATNPGADAALGRDPDGRRQPLLAVYRERALRARLAGLDVVGCSLRTITEGLRIVEVPVGHAEALDLDTAEDAATAERFIEASSQPSDCHDTTT